jgi:hypothetical protein
MTKKKEGKKKNFLKVEKKVKNRRLSPHHL